MKRSLHFALILSAAFACAALSSCGLTAAQKQQIAANAVKDGDAAALGFLTGGKAGALAGLTAQEIRNIADRQKTAAKQTAASVVP